MVAQGLWGTEVVVDFDLVLSGQPVRPAVAKIFWFPYDARGPRRIDRRDLIRFAVDLEEGGKDLRPAFHRVAVVVFELWNEIVGPRAILALVTMEGREWNDLSRPHRPRAYLRSWRNRSTLFLDRGELTAQRIE